MTLLYDFQPPSRRSSGTRLKKESQEFLRYQIVERISNPIEFISKVKPLEGNLFNSEK